MTEQVRLTGDRSTDSELNDLMVYDRSEIIAFSRYTEAIQHRRGFANVGETSSPMNCISHQYSLWEEALELQ